MARKRDINDIDEDEEGLVDYSGDSDDDNKSKDILLRGDELLVMNNQAFRGETTLPVGVELPKASTHLKTLEKLQELFPETVERVQWDLTEGNFRNVLEHPCG
jgi:hypothetical protein